MDRTPALIDAADPPERGNETLADEAGWADLAARYNEITGLEFIRLPTPYRRTAIRARHATRSN